MKNLVPKSFGIKRITNAICSVLVLTIVVGILFYQGTKQTITVIIDGQEQVVRTHAATVDEILKELEIQVKAEDYILPSKNSQLKEDVQVVWKPAQQVALLQDGKETKVWTTTDTVGELLKEQDIEVTQHDKLSPAKKAPIKEKMEISVEKAFPLTLVVGGKKKQVWSTSTTVVDFLTQQGVKLNELDRVEPKLSEKVQAKNTINVTRVEKVTDVVESPIEYDIVKKEDDSLSEGKEKILTEGKKGQISTQYEVIKENGKEVKRKVIAEKVIKEKQDQVVAVGTKAPTPTATYASNVSSSSGGKEIYVSSTAYTASCNGCSGVTATGMNLKSNPHAKVIAVDPNVIPLGSKVHVEGYGYAVAADKGGAIKGNKIDVFIPSKSEAYRWGVKRVKVRIID
ncbi:G5 and 3D domain-containing protein [Peribacillus asahii]|uniref:G5 and 3D domain-containing protein n=1 Tax=Peribacillus asahii TaxID=228899 RepID=UPI0020799430|nr:G5 and 3D domain-containing protein [Peribacillus asahii]USK59914.1 ubiquitin-like domain-containing protein [Peribacillus asahii]